MNYKNFYIVNKKHLLFNISIFWLPQWFSHIDNQIWIFIIVIKLMKLYRLKWCILFFMVIFNKTKCLFLNVIFHNFEKISLFYVILISPIYYSTTYFLLFIILSKNEIILHTNCAFQLLVYSVNTINYRSNSNNSKTDTSGNSRSTLGTCHHYFCK